MSHRTPIVAGTEGENPSVLLLLLSVVPSPPAENVVDEEGDQKTCGVLIVLVQVKPQRQRNVTVHIKSREGNMESAQQHGFLEGVHLLHFFFHLSMMIH